MSRLKIIPWVLGAGLLVGSLVGANRLLHPDGTSPGGGPPAEANKKVRPGGNGDSLLAPGTVDCDPPRVTYYLPAHTQAAVVADVLVQDGQEVKPGDVLVRFDSQFQELALKQAEDAYQAAVRAWQQAQKAVQEADAKIEQAKAAVQGAERVRDAAQRARDSAQRQLENYSENLRKNNNLSQADYDKQLKEVKDKPEYLQADAAVQRAEAEVLARKAEVPAAEAAKARYQAAVEQAAFEASARKTLADSARLAVERCSLRADVAGRVERVDVARGQYVGPATRSPILYLIPTGSRVVRAEVAPEFAYRIQDKVGRKVVITDEHNTSLTYEGTVERIPSAFLPKRSAAPDLLAGKPAVVLEVLIRVTDPAPAGKPPLLVGQPVRVNFQ